MSKKLIAVASAAALALTGLVGIAPAMASGPSFTFNAGTISGSAAGTSASAPAETKVVSTNVIDSANDYGVQITVSGLATGDVVRLTSTGSVKLAEAELTTANANVDVTKVGSQSITKTTTSDANLTSLYAFTTSTTAGTVNLSVTRTGLTSSSTLHLEGTAGLAYNLQLVSGVPATLTTGATSVVSFKATDALGNTVEELTADSIEAADFDLSTATAPSGLMGAVTWSATDKVYKSTMTSGATTAFIASVGIKTAHSADIVGFAKANRTLVAVVNQAGVADQVTALTAQVATLTATVAKRVSKKKYNTLARKWNAAFPSQKVALKK